MQRSFGTHCGILKPPEMSEFGLEGAGRVSTNIDTTKLETCLSGCDVSSLLFCYRKHDPLLDIVHIC